MPKVVQSYQSVAKEQVPAESTTPAEASTQETEASAAPGVPEVAEDSASLGPETCASRLEVPEGDSVEIVLEPADTESLSHAELEELFAQLQAIPVQWTATPGYKRLTAVFDVLGIQLDAKIGWRQQWKRPRQKASYPVKVRHLSGGKGVPGKEVYVWTVVGERGAIDLTGQESTYEEAIAASKKAAFDYVKQLMHYWVSMQTGGPAITPLPNTPSSTDIWQRWIRLPGSGWTRQR
jgi:hypothetical protein